MAVSQEGEDTFRFDVGARYAARVAAEVLRHGLPAETILNVNIPNVSFRTIKGVKVTCLSRRRFDNPIVEKVDPRGASITGLPVHASPGAAAKTPTMKPWSITWCP